MKKLIALVLALAMVAVLGLAFADPASTTITIPAGDSHNYSIYQIFTGELADSKLSNVHYGANAKLPQGVTAGALVPQSVLDTIAAYGTGYTEAQIAAAISAYADFSSTAFATATGGEQVTAPTGYYLVRDTDASALGANDEATLYILQVVGPTTITRKAGTTTSDKTTADTNDSTGANEYSTTSGDYDIGDEVPYQVKATLSEKVFMYEDFYKVRFQDTLESGRFSAISELTIKVNGVAIADTDNYTVSITGVDDRDENGFDVTIVFTPKQDKNLASLNNAVVTIDFTATLGEGAQIGGDGNTNTVKVIYSNNPNTDEVGETSEHKVTTFTFKIVVNKTDGENALAGAGFTLYKVSQTNAEAGVPSANAGDAASKNAYWATKAIDGYTKVIAAEAGKTQFSFEGLDDGYYVLAETTTPAGYNTIDPQVFKVEAEHSDTAITSLTGTKLDGSTIEFTPDTGAGSLTTEIVNNSGTVLPSTGGIGTTIFYILGGLLVVGAAVILVARRKAGQN